MSKTKSYSCRYLHHSIYLAPNELRHCCKRFFVDGKMRGDVRIFPVDNEGDIDGGRIRQAKQELYEAINRGEETDCSGCPFLQLEEWPSFAELSVNFVSIESHTQCNMRCTYCDEIYYGGLTANYDLQASLKKLADSGILSKNVSLAWGGGEPLMLKDFDSIFRSITEHLKPMYNRVFSNAIIYSPVVAEFLKKGNATMTTSIDAGTIDTFRKVRGVNQRDKVLGNLSRYLKEANKGLTLKYIFTDDNSSFEEIDAFIEQIVLHSLNECEFQISSNFKSEGLEDHQALSTIYLYKRISEIGPHTCYIDDHLRPRLNSKIKKMHKSRNHLDQQSRSLLEPLFKNAGKPVIVWGAGEYSQAMMKNSLFFNISPIAFFVDSNPEKQGQTLSDIEIRDPQSVMDVGFPIVIGSSMHYPQIMAQLTEMGVSKERILDHLII